MKRWLIPFVVLMLCSAVNLGVHAANAAPGAGIVPQRFTSPSAADKAAPTAEAPAATTAPVVFGVAGPFSGEMAEYGMPSYRAVQMAVELLNREYGGLLGQQVGFYSVDDNCLDRHGAPSAQWLVDQKVTAVVGHVCNGATAAAQPVYARNGVLMVSPSSTDPDLGVEDGLFFRTIPKEDTQADMIMDYCLEQGWKRVVVVMEDEEYERDQAKYLNGHAAVRDGVDVVETIGAVPDGHENDSLAEHIAGLNADVMVYCGESDRFMRLVRRMRLDGDATPVIGMHGINDADQFEFFPKDAQNIYMVSVDDISGHRGYDNLRDIYFDRYRESPGPFFYEAWAAMECLIEAIWSVGSTEPQLVAAALREQWYDTVLGKISFDQRGEVVGAGYRLLLLQQGELVEVYR